MVWNNFTANVDVEHMSTHQVKSTTHPDSDSVVELKMMPDSDKCHGIFPIQILVVMKKHWCADIDSDSDW